MPKNKKKGKKKEAAPVSFSSDEVFVLSDDNVLACRPHGATHCGTCCVDFGLLNMLLATGETDVAVVTGQNREYFQQAPVVVHPSSNKAHPQFKVLLHLLSGDGGTTPKEVVRRSDLLALCAMMIYVAWKIPKAQSHHVGLLCSLLSQWKANKASAAVAAGKRPDLQESLSQMVLLLHRAGVPPARWGPFADKVKLLSKTVSSSPSPPVEPAGPQQLALAIREEEALVRARAQLPNAPDYVRHFFNDSVDEGKDNKGASAGSAASADAVGDAGLDGAVRGRACFIVHLSEQIPLEPVQSWKDEQISVFLAKHGVRPEPTPPVEVMREVCMELVKAKVAALVLVRGACGASIEQLLQGAAAHEEHKQKQQPVPGPQFQAEVPGVGAVRTQACPVCWNVATSVCSGCKQVWYCSKQCQSEHWGTHKPTCKASAKALKIAQKHQP